MMNLIDMKTVIILCVVSVHAKPPNPERNLCSNAKNIKRSVSCKPKKVFVNILPDTNEIQPQIMARVVQVKRCMGFDGVTRCVPKETVNVTVKVQLVQSRKCQTFLVEEHTACKSELVRPTTKPLCGPRQRWNKKKSICECFSECTTGSVFDKKSCSCLDVAKNRFYYQRHEDST